MPKKGYTTIQQLRKMRATNKGANRRVASDLRTTADWLDKKGPEEFSASEVKLLQGTVKMINLRLEMNARTKSSDELIAEIEIEKRKAAASRPR